MFMSHYSLVHMDDTVIFTYCTVLWRSFAAAFLDRIGNNTYRKERNKKLNVKQSVLYVFKKVLTIKKLKVK